MVLLKLYSYTTEASKALFPHIGVKHAMGGNAQIRHGGGGKERWKSYIMSKAQAMQRDRGSPPKKSGQIATDRVTGVPVPTKQDREAWSKVEGSSRLCVYACVTGIKSSMLKHLHP